MPSPTLLLLLAALPCAERGTLTRELEETAATQPRELPAAVDRLVQRMEGLPLPAAEEGATEAERVRQVATYLEQACALQESAALEQAPPPAGDPDRLRAILDRPEFARARQRSGDVLKRMLRELQLWLEGLFESRGAQGFAVATRAVMLGVALAVVLFGVLRLRFRRRPRAGGVPGTAGPAHAPLVLDSPGEHLGRARAALGVPDAREAIREGLLGLLSALEQRRLARPDRVKTNRELAAELPTRGASAPVTGEVERLVAWYDRAFYSLAPVPQDEAARFVDDVERLHGSLAEGAR